MILKYPATIIFLVKLHTLIKRLSHLLIVREIIVKFTTRKYRHMKKYTAPAVCKVPVPPISIVPIAAKYPNTDNIVGQYIYE